jgi:hypothetical protein
MKSSLKEVVSEILQYNSIYLRKVLNSDITIKTIVTNSDKFEKSYGAVINRFQTALANAVESGASTFSVENTKGTSVEFSTESARKVSEGGGSYRSYFGIYSKLIPGLSQKWQLGHKSAAVLTFRIAASIDALRKQQNPANDNLIKELLILLESSREIDKVTEGSKFALEDVYNIIGDYVQNPPRLNASVKKEIGVLTESNMTLVLEFEDAGLNRLKGSAGSVIGRLVTRLLNGQIDSVVEGIKKVDLTEITASPSFFDEIKKLLLDTIDPKTTPKGKKTKSSASGRGASGSRPKKLPKLRKAPPAAAPKGTATAEVSSFIGVRSVLSYINARLPETVRSKMDYPRLENRTGRFANSTELLSITPTPKGFPSLAYTYQKNPYQVFEVGRGKFPWATPFRDPRKIIEESIREIARDVIEGRFYMRRL